jgi:hypothetical protein
MNTGQGDLVDPNLDGVNTGNIPDMHLEAIAEGIDEPQFAGQVILVDDIDDKSSSDIVKVDSLILVEGIDDDEFEQSMQEQRKKRKETQWGNASVYADLATRTFRTETLRGLEVSSVNIEWNKYVQELMEQLWQASSASPTDSHDWLSLKLKCAKALSSLAKEFLSCAELYAKTIIREQFVCEELRTVRSATSKFKGIAGGSKFEASGILFKFISGTMAERLYGSYENAMKATRLDLVGCEALTDSLVSGIRGPLMGLITYKYVFKCRRIPHFYPEDFEY